MQQVSYRAPAQPAPFPPGRTSPLQVCWLGLAGAILNTRQVESSSSPKPFHIVPFWKAPLLGLGQGRGYKERE